MFGLVCPSGLRGQDQKPPTNVNSRYEVEKVEISGIAEAKVSKTLRDDMQKLVGEKYDQEAAQKLADRMRKELRDYSITVKAKRGDMPDHVKVLFEAERTLWKRFEFPVPPAVYESKEGLSGAIEVPIDFQLHSVFTVGLVDSADGQLERNAGLPSDRRIELRIGVHIGDVVEEDDGDLMGDGVNIAARLEGIAKPGAICLSDQAYWQVKSRLDIAVSDLGITQLKNIAEPVRAFSVEIGVPS